MKYIIDIPDDGQRQYRYNEDTKELKFPCPRLDPNSFMGLDIIISGATPHTEPDRKAIEDEVWELADYMCRMDVQERNLCFGFQSTTEVTVNLSYQEAKSKFEAWKKQKGDIRVGDEVVDAETDKGIVTYIRGYLCDVLWDDGGVTEEVEREELYKTGRHFDEVEELLKKIREEE